MHRCALLVCAALAGLASGCPPDDEGDDELFDPALARDAGVEAPLDACALETNKDTLASPGAVYFGTRGPTLVPLDEAQQNAIVGIADPFTAGSFCTGTLISADVVLTAQHCTAGIAAAALTVLFGADEFAPLLVVGVVEKRETDPDTDLALLRLEQSPLGLVDVRPIPIAALSPVDDDVGTLVEAAGFGDTHDGSEGRYFVTERFDALGAQFITVDGGGERGVCFGDSGGPVLRVSEATNDVRVYGALSYGDAECTNVDHYSRVDTQRAFIEALAGPTPGPTPPSFCPSTITAQGACSAQQAVAMYCEAGFVVVDACAADEVCATRDDGRARCVSASDDPCGGVTRFGDCAGGDDETLTWCDDGVVRTRDCGACGERCLLVDGVAGFACVASTCGDLDATGVCDGDVARWCDRSGQAQEQDCGDDGCDYLGPILGNYCWDPVACEGFTYQGACDGTVLTWCEDNELVVYDCADEGAACVFVDDETGFVCE